MFVLFIIGIIAGLIEASAGGSGLISLPAIMLSGYPPIEAIATSKFQNVFGALTSIVQYSRAGLISWRRIAPMLVGAMVSGAAGAYCLSIIDSEVITIIVPFLLLAAAIYFFTSPRISDNETSARISHSQFGILIVPIIAFYDGFFGVGSASLYMTAFVFFLGLNVRSATANTKLIDCSSGFAALIVLALKGHVLLLPGLSLGAGQIIGAYLGSSLVMRFGARWVKPLLVVVTLIMSVDLLVRNWNLIVRLFMLEF